MLQESEGRIKCLANGDTWVFVASGVAGSSGEKTLARDFWRERSAEREKRSLHLLREKVRGQNHERDSERIGAWFFYLAQQNS